MEGIAELGKRAAAIAAGLVLAACLALSFGAAPSSAYAADGAGLVAASVETASVKAVAKAAPVKLMASTIYVGMSSGPSYRLAGNDSSVFEKATLVKVTSSNTKVLKAKKYSSKGLWNAVLTPKKPGKATLTVTYKYKGKTYKTSAKYTVKKYPNAIASVLVNGKKIKLSANKFNYFVSNYKKSSATVKVNAASGWVVMKDVNYYAYKSGSSGGQSKTIKNGAKFSVLKKTTVNINTQLVNVKSGETFSYSVGFYRS